MTEESLAIGASRAFLLSTSTPPNAIVYGMGLFSITAMMQTGAIVDALSFALISAGPRIPCPLPGLA